MTPGLYLTVALPLLLAAAVFDVVARMVPNRLCLALGLDGLALQIGMHSLPFSILAALAVFVPAAVVWRHGMMGGGDVKLLGAASLLVPPALVPMLVLAVAMSGGVLGVAYWCLGRLLRARSTPRPRNTLLRVLRIERHRIRNGFSLPYAVAIVSGVMVVVHRSLSLPIVVS